jgi:hypothetical protein
MARKAPLLLLLPAILSAAATVTYNKDIAPILQKHCQGCHRSGEAAPFSVATYKDTRPWAKAIRAAVLSRRMPPWFANPAHGKFLNDPRLSAAEIEAVRIWADSGAPEGDPKDAPEPPVFSDGWKIGTPDLVVEIPVAYPVPAQGTVDYIWMAVDPKIAEDKWIERIEVRPGARSVVHHVLAFARRPGSKYRPDLQPGDFKDRPEKEPDNRGPQSPKGFFAFAGANGTEMIADYVPNGDPFIAPEGHARFIAAGSHMLFQMHYTTNGQAVTDRTQVGIVFAKKPPKYRIVNDAVMNPTIRIPPGAPNHQAEGTVTVQHDTRIGGFGPHMHVRGKAMRYELLRPGAEPEILLDVPNYDFNWQIKYQPAHWVDVKKGDRIRVTAWYDNSPNNRNNPDPSKEVFWGDQSWSEMLFAFLDYVVPVDVDPGLVTGAVKPAPAAGGAR